MLAFSRSGLDVAIELDYPPNIEVIGVVIDVLRELLPSWEIIHIFAERRIGECAAVSAAIEYGGRLYGNVLVGAILLDTT